MTVSVVLYNPVLSSEQKGRSDMNRFNGSHQKIIERAQQIFAKRGYEYVGSEQTHHGEILLFTQNKTLHLVYCLPDEMYVTTIEIQACWEAQSRLGANSSSMISPHRYSDGAIQKAWELGIELL